MKAFLDRRKTSEESGFFTIWLVMLTVLILGMAGISLDVWHGFSQRRELAAITDAATITGASQIDLTAFRADGTVQLDPVAARDAALTYLSDEATASGITFTSTPIITVTPTEIDISASTEVQLTLMKLFAPNTKLPITTHSASSPQEAL